MSDKQKVRLSELNCYLVGGAVRDQLLNIDRTDKDWVVVGTTEATMQSLGFRPIGKNFPVFLHPESHEEYALARTERKTGKGYKGFEVDASPTVSLEQDLFRRDLTINAMALDTEDNLIDPFGGRQDLENGLLRHVSVHFSEDPLRVLRVARFAARYHSRGFIVEDSTLELMHELSDSGELDYLVPERVLQEVLSALSEDHPAVFFTVLRVCDALVNLFPEINKIYDLRPDTVKPLLELELAAHLTDDVKIRFSVLACLINKFATKSPGEQKNTIAIQNFCRRLKTSTSYRTLAEQVAAYSDRVMQKVWQRTTKVTNYEIKYDTLTLEAYRLCWKMIPLQNDQNKCSQQHPVDYKGEHADFFNEFKEVVYAQVGNYGGYCRCDCKLQPIDLNLRHSQLQGLPSSSHRDSGNRQ